MPRRMALAATETMTSGVNPRAVADRLGPAGPSLTMRVYTHPDADTDRSAGPGRRRLIAVPDATSGHNGA